MNRAPKSQFRLDWYTPSNDLLNITATFSLKEIIFIERCKFMYKIDNNIIKHNINLEKNYEFHRYPTRNKNNFRLKESRTINMSKGILDSIINYFRQIL